ncbi:MAG: sigma factor, partial [Opitutaceae bacterium]
FPRAGVYRDEQLMSDDSQLLRHYTEEGSETAFTEFVRRHIDLVFAAASRRMTGDTHAAADVTQQVFIAASRHARALAHHPRLTGWLYTTTQTPCSTTCATNNADGNTSRRSRP